MSLVSLGSGSPKPPVPPLEEWSEDRLRAVYEIAEIWASLTTLAKWVTIFAAFWVAIASLGYYVLSTLSLIHGNGHTGKG